ncbi:MAG: amino acid adenylation domain-containing protein [Proteobacteria bacterium]|nr:amino acid adenylation domain-containing protein [Pseudomonadota bacterium]
MSDVRRRLRGMTAQQIAALAKRLGDGQAPPEDGRARLSSVQRAVLSGMQRRIWFAQRTAPHSPAFNNAVALDIDGPLDPARLRAALTAVLARHPILRTPYDAVGDHGEALPAADAVEFDVIDLSGEAPSICTARRDALLNESAARVFDLERGPLVRVRVVSTGALAHAVALTVHHVAFDAWSRSILMAELAAAYCDDAAVAGLPAALDYAEYVARGVAPDAAETARLEAFWRPLVADLPPSPLEGISRQASGLAQDACHMPVAVSDAVWARVESTARTRRTTLFPVALAALALALSRLSGLCDIPLITSRAAREDVRARSVVGPLIDTLLIRLRIEALTAGELIDAAASAWRSALAHGSLPFESVVALSGCPAEAGAHPLSRIALVLDSASQAEWRIPGLVTRARNLHPGASPFDLLLLLERRGATTINASLDYRVDVLNAAAAHAIGRAFVNALEGLSGDPALPLAAIGAVDGEEASRLVTMAIGETPLTPESAVDAGRQFVDVAHRHPEAVALWIGGNSTSYRDLLCDATRIAHLLHDMGAGPGVLVAVALPRDRAFFGCMLGILLAGATFLLLDVVLSPDVVTDVLTNASAAVLLSRSAISSRLGIPPLTMCVDVDTLPAHSAAVLQLPAVPVDGARPAYRIYTSGSTGRPKGIEIDHRAMVQLAAWQRAWFGLGAGDVVSQLSTPSFDAIIGECCMALLSGATLAVVDDARRTPEAFARFLVEREVVVAVVVPSFLTDMPVDAVPPAPDRWLVVVGEAFPPTLAAIWMPRRRVVNAYGPAEFTVYATAHELRAEDLQRREGLIPIGRARHHSRAYVLDRHLSPVPCGIPGELYLAGDGVAMRYVDAPAETAAAFLPDPYAAAIRGPFDLRLPEADRAIEAFVQTCDNATDVALSGTFASDDTVERLCHGLDPVLTARTLALWTSLDSDEARHGFVRYLGEGARGLVHARGLEPTVLGYLLDDPLTGLRGVDLGSGGGETLDALSSWGANAVGVDLCPWLVARSRARGHHVVQAMIDSELATFSRETGLAPGSLDFSVATLVLDRVASPARMLGNLVGVLRPGGRFALQMLLPNSPFDTDGGVRAYTPEIERIGGGLDSQAQLADVVRRLAALGARNMTVYRLPYAILTSEGVERMLLWSVAGTASGHRLGARMYRTGDRVVLQPDGGLAFLGRIDRQLKVRGARLDPGEVERLIECHSAVARAVVAQRAPVPDAPAVLVAWCVPRDPDAVREPEAMSAEIRSHVARSLPHWAVPQHVEFIAALPLGPSGKPDESQLRLTLRDRAAATAPRDQRDAHLLDVCRRVLGAAMRGIDDSVFDAGADSILLLRISADLQDAGLRLEMRDYFECRTVRALAERITSALEPTPAQGATVPSPIQKWAMAHSGGAPAWWVQWCVVAVGGEVGLERLQRALMQVVETHDALRTAVGTQCIEVMPAADAAIPIHLAADRMEALALARSEIDPARARMLAAALIGEAGELVLVASHFAVDAVSWGILAQDLAAAYRGMALRPPAMGHVDAVRALQALASDPERLAEGAIWLERTAGCVAAAPPAPIETLAAERLEPRLTHALEAAAVRLSTSPQALLHAALVGLVQHAAGASRVCIDVESNGRALAGADLSRTVGWFTALYPVAVDFDPAWDAVERARASAEAFAAARDAGLGFRLLAAYHEDDEVRSRLAAWRAPVVLNYLGRMQMVAPDEWLIRGLLDFGGAWPPADVDAPYHAAVDAWIDSDDYLQLRLQCTARSLLGDAGTLAAALVAQLRAQIEAIDRCLPFRLGMVPASLDTGSIVAAAASRDAAEVQSLNPMQAGMLFHVRAAAGTGVYENQMRFRLRGKFEPERWREAWRCTVRREAVFRTGFVSAGAATLRVVGRELSADAAILDLRAAWPSPHAAANAYAAEDRSRSFDLEQPPLARMSVLWLGDDDWEVVWTFHHLIVDGWSVAILLEEMLRVYADGTSDAAAPGSTTLLDLPLPASPAAHAFWTKVLAGAIPGDPLRLGPIGDPGDLSSAHDEAELILGEAESSHIVELAQRAGVTFASYFQAAWALVLARHSRSSEVIFGLTLSGREHLAHAERAIGLFVTTVPVRVRVRGSASPSELMHEVQQAALARRAHVQLPLGDIQRCAGVVAPDSLFNHVLLIENFPVDCAFAAMVPTVELRDMRCRQRSHYPATLVVVPGDRIRLELSWERGRLSESRAHYLLEALRSGLARLGDGSCSRVDEIAFDAFDSGSPTPIAVAPRAPCYSETTIHARFEAIAAHQPQAVALIDGERILRFGELEAWSNRLAAALIARGVSFEDRVGLLATRSFEAIAGMLAILKAGAAWVPLDPTYPAQRIRRFIETSRPVAILTHRADAADFIDARLASKAIDIAAYETGAVVSPPRVSALADALAYVLFTSGSTGAPKGVMGTHRATLAAAAWRELAFPHAPGECCVHKTPLGFGDSIQEIFGPLLAGASLAILSSDAIRDPHRFVQEMRGYGVTRLIVVPSLLTAILASSAPVESLTAARLWIASGEALPIETVRAFRGRLPGARLINLYGASEAACDDTWTEVVDAERPPGIGGPIAGASIYLLDDRMRVVENGGLGEIHVGGEVVARGYFDDPRQTASAFIPDPGAHGGRMFRTRDIGQYQLAEGLRYHGRADQQVVLRGIRIDLAEVEAALMACPGVADAAVCHDAAARGLVAFVMPDERERLVRGGRYRILPDGLALFDYRRSETDYLLAERDEGDTPLPMLPDGAVVIDVGANIGLFSLATHYAADGVRIVAIEPSPVVASVLRDNLVLHGCTFELLTCAVGAHSGTAPFTFYAHASLESGLHADAARDEHIFRVAIDARLSAVDVNRLAAQRFEGETSSVEVVTLSEVIARLDLPRIDLVKIDVERAELEVLQGLAPQDFARIDRFLMEVEDTGGMHDAIAKLFPPEFVLRWTPHGRLERAGLWMLEATRNGVAVAARATPRVLEPPRSALSERALRMQLAQTLPGYMLPARLQTVDALPRTPSGKLDRRALLSMPVPSPQARRTMDERECLLADIWRTVLRRDDVGPDDNFFDVGGHSLLTLEVLDRLEAKGVAGLTVPDFYQYPTIAAFAAFMLFREGEGGCGDDAARRGALRGDRRRARRSRNE